MTGNKSQFLCQRLFLLSSILIILLNVLSNFGVNVEVLSRFQTKTQQTEILAKLKKGRVDLIIGTHRLLSKDVEFFDLKVLMIIDEEQRFGVKHKERLKELKTQVDVFDIDSHTYSRTLHMSMLGIRDLSVVKHHQQTVIKFKTYVMKQTTVWFVMQY